MSDPKEHAGLLFAYRISGIDASALSWNEIKDGVSGSDGEYFWIGLNRGHAETRSWLQHKSGLHGFAARALLAEETRPRVTHFGDGLLVNLRGVNLNPGDEPEDMVSARFWIDTRRVIVVRQRSLKALTDARRLLDHKETTPETPGALFTAIAGKLTDRMEPVVEEAVDRIDALEDESLDGGKPGMRGRLAELRRKAIILRRYIAPQRDVLHNISADVTVPFDERPRLELRETADRVTRLVEELDAVRERASVINDQLVDMRAEDMNRNMMILSVVAAIFLPLSFLTGLLGVNLAGIPGADSPSAFAILVALMAALAAGLVYYFYRKGWL